MILILCMACACAAAETADPVTENMPSAGLTFTRPAAMNDTEGIVGTDGALRINDQLFYAYWYYCAGTQEEFEAILDGDPGAQEGRVDTLFYVFSVGGGRGFTALNDYTNAFSADEAVEIGKAEDWTFYLYMTCNQEFAGGVEQKYADEYMALCGMKDEIASAFTCSIPVSEDEALAGQVIEFSTLDLDGNPVSSEELFAQHEITMVNIWATWCMPCVGELAELQALHTRFLEKDCAVVGMMTESDLEEAKRLITENGITYPMIYEPDNMIVPYQAIPTSFFVNRKGEYIGSWIVGAAPDQYEPALDRLLEQIRNVNP